MKRSVSTPLGPEIGYRKLTSADEKAAVSRGVLERRKAGCEQSILHHQPRLHRDCAGGHVLFECSECEPVGSIKVELVYCLGSDCNQTPLSARHAVSAPLAEFVRKGVPISYRLFNWNCTSPSSGKSAGKFL